MHRPTSQPHRFRYTAYLRKPHRLRLVTRALQTGQQWAKTTSHNYLRHTIYATL
jgi:hypothetical protein